MNLNVFTAGSVLAVSVVLSSAALAQGTRADYERANKLRELTQRKVFKAKVEAHWLPDNTHFWYRNELPDNAREFVLVDAEKGTRSPAFDHAAVAKALSETVKRPVSAQHLPMAQMDFSETGSVIRFHAFGKSWRYDLETAALNDDAGKGGDGSMSGFDQPRPSLRTGEETSITFINHSRAPINLYWMTPEGNRQQYAKVPVGEQYNQHTFAGHVWMVADD